ncbi:hypothetical protein ScPMuIL_003255 [Solemya velum]
MLGGYKMFVLVLLFATISAQSPISCRQQYLRCVLKKKSETRCKLEELGCLRTYCERYAKTDRRPKAALLICFIKNGIFMLLPDA